MEAIAFNPGRFGWLVTFEKPRERVRKSDTLEDLNGAHWSIWDITEKGPDGQVQLHVVQHAPPDDSILFGEDPQPRPVRQQLTDAPALGRYKVLTAISTEAVSVAARWWVSRLRGDEDPPVEELPEALMTALHQHDVMERASPPGAKHVGNAAMSMLRRKPIPEETLIAVETYLRDWLNAQYLRPSKESRVPINTDYQPGWPPLLDIVRQHPRLEFRFPFKTRMSVYLDKVIVNGRCIHGGDPQEPAP